MAEACGDERELRAQCQTLEQLLSSRTTTSDNTDGSRVDDSDCKDIDGVALYDELDTLCKIFPNDVCSPLDVLRYLYDSRLHEVFPNLAVALRILLTLPVTVASAERSFSKLKLIKTYLRSTMNPG